MTAMRFLLTTSTDNGITLLLTSDETPERIETVIRDTDQGTDIRTEVVNRQGNSAVIQDKIDRVTPPLEVMMHAVNTMMNAIATNAQAALNTARYERLKAEGRPITMQTMCMDGLHTGPEYADKPFVGGIVGVPVHDHDEPELPEVTTDFLNALWGDDEEDAA